MKIQLFFHLFKEFMKKISLTKNDPSDLLIWGFEVVVNIISRICYKNVCKGIEGIYMRF